MLIAPLVLASSSAVRAKLLAGAGLGFETRSASLDERSLERHARDRGAGPVGIARHLARQKAIAVSRLVPSVIVVGADQTLSLDGTMFHKPADRAAARAQIAALADKTHLLASGRAVARDGKILGDLVDTACLTMRALDAAAIEAYLDEVGTSAWASVGAYQIEGPGQKLFTRVEGAMPTIMGLPMQPLLLAFRRLGLFAV